jgi:MFS family permease
VGGLLVDHASWRWVFLVNLPIGLIALVVTAIELPKSTNRVNHVIDYAGVVLLTAGSSSIILFTSLGGSSIAWGSGWSIGFITAGLVLLALFAQVERRAVEPILSMRLMKNPVVSSASSIGFVTGFAMYGAMTFLPLYFQVVRGSSATISGLKLLPLMVGLFATSIASGQLLARGWRYRRFPIIGTIVTTIGLALLGLVTATTSSWALAGFMIVLGAGLGMTMQVLVTAAQNAVEMRDLGAATGATNFFRSMGGSVGTAVFGALFNNILPHKEHAALAPLLSRYGNHIPPLKNLTPAMFATLPHEVAHAIVSAYATAISAIYHWTVPFGLVAIVLAFTLPDGQLRGHHGSEAPAMSAPIAE